MVSGGTDTHLLLLDVSNQNTNGLLMEKALEVLNVATNKNTIPGDKSAMRPSGLRIGTPAMTTRGLDQQGFKEVARIIMDVLKKCNDIGNVKSDAFMEQYLKDEAWIDGMRKRVAQVVEGLDDVTQPDLD